MPAETQQVERRSLRRPLRLAVILISDPEGQEAKGEAYTADFSQHGLRVQTNLSLNPGQVVEVITNDGPEFAVRGRVVWIGEPASERAGEAGLEFLLPLPTTA